MGRTMPYVDGNYDFADVRDVADGLILAGEAGRTGETYIVSGDRISVRYILDSVRQATGRAFRLVRIPLKLAAFVAGFTPFYYRWTRKRPRFTSYSLDVLRSNSHVSHAKATRELGYHPRPLFESISDTAHWFLENLFLFYGPAPT
jgi:nucleoside-diphosphate-sugar epimerase